MSASDSRAFSPPSFARLLSSGISMSVKSAYRAFGEYVYDSGVYFGNERVYMIREISPNQYRIHFSDNDTGMLVSSYLSLTVYTKEGK